jgi:hypothetical protein
VHRVHSAAWDGCSSSFYFTKFGARKLADYVPTGCLGSSGGEAAVDLAFDATAAATSILIPVEPEAEHLPHDFKKVN